VLFTQLPDPSGRRLALAIADPHGTGAFMVVEGSLLASELASDSVYGSANSFAQWSGLCRPARNN